MNRFILAIAPLLTPLKKPPKTNLESLRLGFLVLVGLVLAICGACSTEVRGQDADAGAAIRANPPPSTVILISMDGTRPADVTPETLPSLVKLGARGAVSEGLIPVSPSNTFPSHVSMATGVHPEEHRLVNNRFIDPDRGPFDRGAPNEWVESEPIWSVAERHGLPTASYFWVGSEGPWSGGPGPLHTRKFSSSTLEKTKVNRILNWLALPDPKERPVLITTWFHGADHAGHVSGPGAPSVAKELAPQDLQIARLVAELEARGLFESTTLIFVSDHGMAGAAREVNLGLRLGRAGLDLKTIGIGGFSTLVFDQGKRTEAGMRRAVEIARSQGLEAHLRTEAPRSWHVNDPRFGDVVVRAPIGTAIVTSTTLIDGFHGYDPEAKEMAGMFVAYGRGVKPGAQIGRVSSLSIAPTVLRLLGLPIPEQMKTAPIPELLEGIPGT